jgi:hypothetical protein
MALRERLSEPGIGCPPRVIHLQQRDWTVTVNIVHLTRQVATDQLDGDPFSLSRKSQPVMVTYGPALVCAGCRTRARAGCLAVCTLVDLYGDTGPLGTEARHPYPHGASVMELLAAITGRTIHNGMQQLNCCNIARVEPRRPSWRLVHFVLNDAGRYLFSSLVSYLVMFLRSSRRWTRQRPSWMGSFDKQG